MAKENFKNFPWIAPWQPISEQGQEAYENELQLEVSPGHPLHGVRARAIGRTSNTDDVLFALEDHLALFAVVHLTYVGRPEHSPKWPTVVLYQDLDQWVMEGMLQDAASFENSQSDRAA
jgi:hypothetical protein